MESGSLAIFWDYGSCPPASSMSGYHIAERIFHAVHTFGPVKQFKAYLSTMSTEIPSRLRMELQTSGVSIVDTSNYDHGSQLEKIKLMYADMFAFAMDNPPSSIIILISGDEDFTYALSILRLRRHRLILISSASSAEHLRGPASVVLEWSTDVLYADIPDKHGSTSAGKCPKCNSTLPLTTSHGSTSAVHHAHTHYPSQTSANRNSMDRNSNAGVLVTGDQTPIAKDLPSVTQTPSKQPTSNGINIGDVSGKPSSPVPSNPTSVLAYTSPTRHPTLNANSFASTSALDGGWRSRILSTPSPPKTAVPPTYKSLVETLQAYRSAGNDRPLRSELASKLITQDPEVYRRAGASKFAPYARMAEEAGIIEAGGEAGVAWLTLRPQWYDVQTTD